MPKLKPLNIKDYSKLDLFFHAEELKILLVDLYQRGIIRRSTDCYLLDFNDLTLRIKCNRLEDVIQHNTDLNLINASLCTWIGSWSSNKKTSHTMIDQSTLFSFLKIIDDNC